MRRVVLLLALLLLLAAPAAAATISTTETTAYVGQAPKEVNIILDSAPAGLSGYDITVSLTNTTAATIAAASLPGWATVGEVGTLPASSVRLTAADINDQVSTGASGVVLATLAVQALAPGTTSFTVTVSSLDDDTGAPISANVTAGTVTLADGLRPKSSVAIPTLDEGPYDHLMAAIGGTHQLNETTEGVDFLGIKDAVEEPYTALLGSIFYAIVFALPFLMQWLRQGSMAIPSVLGIILGAIMLSATPPEYHLAAVVFIALGVLAVVWSVIKDRV